MSHTSCETGKSPRIALISPMADMIPHLNYRGDITSSVNTIPTMFIFGLFAFDHGAFEKVLTVAYLIDHTRS